MATAQFFCPVCGYAWDYVIGTLVTECECPNCTTTVQGIMD